MFDRLPTPYGLVRAGVAPDHPKIKSVIRVYEKTAARPGFRFFGNVEVGRDVSAAELAERYHAVVFAYGTSATARSASPARTCPAAIRATEFVGWYNAHPDFADHEFDLSLRARWSSATATSPLDVARMLVLTREELAQPTRPITPSRPSPSSGIERDRHPRPPRPRPGRLHQPRAPRARRADRCRHRHRRVRVRPDAVSRAVLDSDDAEPTNRAQRRAVHPTLDGREPEAKRQRIVLRFLRSPVEIHGDGRVERLRPREQPSSSAATTGASRRDTGERETIERGLVFRSIGYRGCPSRACPSTSARPDPQRGRPRVAATVSRSRPVRRRLDQARALRRDRHQQEGRPGDRRQLVADLEAGKLPEPELAPIRRRSSRCCASTSPTTSPTGLAGDRRRRGRPRRARTGRPRVKPIPHRGDA